MSVELQNLRQELMREALLHGWTRPADVPAPWTGQVESSRIERWYRRMYKAETAPLPVQQRLVNHFMLGADPEFIFHDGMRRADARSLQLKAGPAFGADNNGRLCELRPAPSRSALSVLASIWLAMRWMTVFYDATLAFSWRAGSYFEGDGLGGHIHFGRKRLTFRDRELAVLDRVTHLQFVSGIFDRNEGRLRVQRAQGAPAGQPYGALSDMRAQPHGYEYRTLPSWVDNPWLAYFNLVLGKLVVAFPELVPPLTETDAGLTSEQARAQLRMLLAYYAPLDDDARLAYAILQKRGFPAHVHGTDFKGSWGIFPSGPLGHAESAKPPSVLPAMVPPRVEDEQELALSMFESRVPELTALVPTWHPSTLPEGYVHLIHYVETKLAPGLGELAMDLCVHKDLRFHLLNAGHGPFAFRFSVRYESAITRTGLLKKLGVPACVDISESDQLYVNASKDFKMEQLQYGMRQILESRIFPLFKIETVQQGSYQDWMASRSVEKSKKGAKLEFSGRS